jgi:hypothetical protein
VAVLRRLALRHTYRHHALMATTFDERLGVTEEQIQTLLCSAWQGGINYWARIVDAQADTEPVFEHDYPLCGSVTFEDLESGGRLTLDRTALHKGLAIMANKYPRHFAALKTGDDDAATADVMVQCAVFGDVIYG